MGEIDEMVRAETAQLVGELGALDDEQWDVPSLCAGWRVRDVVAHLLMPYELSVPAFLAKMIAARFRFDTVADRVATRDRRANRDLLAALQTAPDRRFTVPGAPAEAPLSHLVIHGEDVYRPLGLRAARSATAADTTLDQVTRSGFVPKGRLDGLALVATDTGWRHGEGAEVTGPAAALISTISGRAAAFEDLAGAGVAEFRARVVAG